MNAIVENLADKTADVENVIREFAPRDIRRRQRQERSEDAATQINLVIARVAGTSFDEIDQVISTLQTMKDTLRQEGERLQREIAGYASLSHSAAISMKVIVESLAQWKPDRVRPGPN